MTSQTAVEKWLVSRGFTFKHPEGFEAVWPAPTFEAINESIRKGTWPILERRLREREEAFRQWEFEPLDFGYEPPTWKEADAELRLALIILAAFGANRMSKSWWALKRACEAARAYPNGVILIGSETEDSSKGTAQKIVWHYFQQWLQPYNDERKRHHVVKVNYSQANGFTDGKLVLPNATEMIFMTYKEDPGKYEGFEFGARVVKPATRPAGSEIENIGFVVDESCPLKCLEMVTRRGRFRRCKGIWPFTPINGLTPAMKEFQGAMQILSDRPAVHLPAARISGCRPGHMPRTALPAYQGGRIFWFHIGDNPLGGYAQTVVEACANRSTEIKERLLYGYARDAIARAFPKFGPVHIVEPADLPANGRNYRIVDPAEARPFFVIWVRVHEGALWIYRDWPDRRFGEWAVPTVRETSQDSRKGWDGDRGPAQGNLGLGVEAYKRAWFECERIHHLLSGREEVDPFRRRLQERLKPEETVYETIHGSLIDPRAGPRKDVTDKGGTCLVWRFAVEHRPTADEVLPPIHFQMAPGLEVDKGVATINSLLEYAEDQPLDPVTNSPKLYVSTACEQVLWAMQNYTGKSGEEGACKDPVDCVRMAATSRLVSPLLPLGTERSGAGWG